MRQSVMAFIRTTLVGGVVFLLPAVVIIWICGQAAGMAGTLAKPLAARFPVVLPGPVAAALATVLILGIAAFAAGLFARTRVGHGLFEWIENSVVGTLPQFSFVRGIAGATGHTDRHVDVVLVPADAGLALGFVFERRDAAWVPVFIPGAPQWTSGSLNFAAQADVRDAGIGFGQAVLILQRLGVGSAAVDAALALAETGEADVIFSDKAA